MRLSILVIVCFGAACAIKIEQYHPPQRGVLSGLLNGGKPNLFGKPSENENEHEHEHEHEPDCPDEHHDGCHRQYPLTPKNDQQVPYAFNRYGISPFLTEPPKHYLEVNYADIHKCQPHLGNEVNVCGLKHKPHDIKWKCRSDKKYTLFFVDLYPMGESHPKLLSQGILWWVVDIPGCNVPKGFQIYKYQSPLPLYSSGKDKYAFLAYEQPPYDIDWKEESLVSSTSEKHRYYNCLDKLVNKYDLKLIAGNFFVSEFKPCIEDILDDLDTPSPQYVEKAQDRAHLDTDPFAHQTKK